MEGWLNAADCQLARSIFRIDDRSRAERMILDWVALQGFGRGKVKSIEMSVGAAITIELSDGSRVFVKAWPGSVDGASLSAQLAVQHAMASRGYPTPAVLTHLSPLGPCWAVVTAYKADGVPTDARIAGGVPIGNCRAGRFDSPRDYDQARGSNLTASELAETAAGATYARAYKARCEHALHPGAACWRGSSRESLRNHGPFDKAQNVGHHVRWPDRCIVRSKQGEKVISREGVALDTSSAAVVVMTGPQERQQ